MIHRSVGGGPDDVVLFCGSGSTGAIDKLVELLGLRIPAALDDRYGLSDAIPESERPVVFIGPYEHHSNELPWRESIADVVTILEDADGRVDLAQLEEELERYADRPLKIGSFSAASNVTGIVTDVDARRDAAPPPRRAQLLGLRGRGPYLPIEMNPDRRARLQGRRLHLAAQVRRRARHAGGARGQALALPQPRPDRAGRRHDPLRQPGRATRTTRSRRCARRVGRRRSSSRSAPASRSRSRTRSAHEIRRREERIVRKALASWRANPRIEVFGNSAVERIGIVSLGVRHPRGLLHSHFVGAVLNDLFGIQVRSGCFCAGPYIHRLRRSASGWSRRMARRGRGRPRRREALAPPRQLQLLHERRGRRLRGRRRQPGGRRGLEAPALLQVRPGHGVLAPRHERPDARAGFLEAAASAGRAPAAGHGAGERSRRLSAGGPKRSCAASSSRRRRRECR